jgi:predicted DNA-binding transcriptional regulator YafY
MDSRTPGHHPDWLVHDTRSRSYTATAAVYRAVRGHASRRSRGESLARYLNLVGLPHAPEESRSGLWAAFPDISIPDPVVFASLNDAINNGRVVVVTYRSMRDPKPHTRTLSPHSLVKVGRRWHVRAYSRENKGFRDYALGRIVSLTHCEEPADCGADDDVEWMTMVTVRLVAHPLLTPEQQEVIRFEYFGGTSARVDTCRGALVSYFIQDVRAALSPDGQRPPDYQLAVENVDDVQPWVFPS